MVRLRPYRNNSRRDNVFVRLHPNTVRALCDQAKMLIGEHNNDDEASFFGKHNNNNYHQDWTIAAINVSLDFLPLKLTWDDGIVRFASYNGGSLVEDRDVDGIEIPQNLFPELSLDESSSSSSSSSSSLLIRVEIVHFCPAASKVSMMPTSASHYEVISHHRHWLEDHGLLGQVSVISTHQVLPITTTVQDGTTHIIPLRVEHIHNSFPSPCWRLVDKSELILLPPPNDDEVLSKRCLLRRIPCQQDIIDCEEMEGLAQLLHQNNNMCPNRRWIHLPPKTVAIHDGEALLSPTTNHHDHHCSIAMLRRNHRTVIVRVIASAHVPDGCIAMHYLVGQQLDEESSSLFTKEFTLTLLDDAVVQENATAFLDAIRPDTLSLSVVHFTHSRKDLSIWNTPPPISSSLYSLRNTAPVHGEYLGLLEALQAMDLDTPIAINDLIVITRNVYMLQNVGGRFEATGGDASVFGFVGELLEKFFSINNTTSPTTSSTCSVLAQHEPLKLSSEAIVLRTNLVEFSKSLGSHHPGCVICGEMGTGKTHSAMMLANIKKLLSGSKTVYLDCRALKQTGDGRMQHILTQINTLDQTDASFCRPVTLIVDNIDVFAAGNGNKQANPYGSPQTIDTEDGVMDQSKLLLDILGAKITTFRESFSDMFVIITCATTANLDQFCKDYGFWGAVHTISPLNVVERSLMFRSSMVRSELVCPEHLGSRFGKLTIGYRCHDFDKFALRLRSLYTAPSSAEIEDELHRFIPICRIGTPLTSKTHELIKVNDIGALFEAKRLLEETVIRPSRYRRIYEAAKIRLPRGLLLYGYPGSGKTSLASALANECGYSMIVCNGPELLDKYIGASESKVRELFYRAASAAPSILFFDEFDALAPRRGSDNSGVTDRIVNQLLTFLDGVSDLTKTNEGTVYIVAATSRPDKIDPALLRPGRLEKHIFCGLADGDSERRDLILKLSAKYPLDNELANAIAKGDLVSAARFPTAGLSGADVDAIFSAAHTIAIHEALGEAIKGSNLVVTIKMDHLRSACDNATQSIPLAEMTRLRSIYSTFSRKKSTEKVALGETGSQRLRVALR